MLDRRLCRLCCGSYSRLAVYSFHFDMGDDAMTYEQWKNEVDDLLLRDLGVSSDDLPDYCYRDDYDAGLFPEFTVAEVVCREFNQ